MANTISRYLSTAAAVLLLLGCTEKEMDTDGRSALTARIADEAPGTKTEYESYEGKFSWNEGDLIAVHMSDGTASGRYQTFEIQPSPSSAETGTVLISSTSSMFRDYYAVYPASAAVAGSYGNTELKVTLPAAYDITDIVAGTATRTADYAPVPMVAVNTPGNNILDFCHVGGLLRIKCSGVPAGTRSIAVTMDKGITGTFAVDVSDVTAPTISAAEATASNSKVTFAISSSGLASETDIILNVPLPCGHYSLVNIKAYASGSTPTKDNDYAVSLDLARHHGKKLWFNFVTFVLEHTGTTLTLDDGTIVQEVFRDDAYEGATGTAPFISYHILSDGVTREAVDVTYAYANADADGLPVRNAVSGEISWTSTMPSTLSSVTVSGSTAKTFSANVKQYYDPVVKEVDSEFLKHAENLKSRVSVGSSALPYDLSMYDIHGTSRGNQPVTANCYIVDRAGWYMFPVVYGNAIDYTKTGRAGYVNGVNTFAYDDGTGTANTNNIWHQFQNFTGTSLITTPFILDDAGITASDVEAVVVWQDVSNATYSFIEVEQDVTEFDSSDVFYDPLTTSYKTSVPYIKFHIPEGTIDPDISKNALLRVTGIRQGNAMIAVRLKDAKTIGGTEYAAKTILWSWHIWVTDGYDTDGDDKGDGLVSIPVTNYDNVTSNMMPVNLGWCNTKTKYYYKDRVWYVRVSQTSGSAAPIIFRIVQKRGPYTSGNSGPYYEWGRKDPFLPGDGYTTSNKAAYSPAGYSLRASDYQVNYVTGGYGDASKSIQNPYIYYSPYWLNGVDIGCPINLWNMASNENGQDIAVSKTVFDPCPPGYCIPRTKAFTGFTTDGGGTNFQWDGFSKFNVEDRDGDGSITEADCEYDYEYGWSFYTNSSKTSTIFFPATGFRYYWYAAVNFDGHEGRYWVAARHSREEGYCMRFGDAPTGTPANKLWVLLPCGGITNYTGYGSGIRAAEEE